MEMELTTGAEMVEIRRHIVATKMRKAPKLEFVRYVSSTAQERAYK